MKHMSFLRFAFYLSILMTGTLYSQAQSRIGYISMSELLQVMPGYKTTDSILANYQQALAEKYQEMVHEFNQQDSSLVSPDTLHYTREQLAVRRQDLSDLYTKIQGYSQQAGQLLQQKQEELMAPIRKKANDLIWELARQHGYTYVLLKETLAVYPLHDDLMPYARQSLGLTPAPR